MALGEKLRQARPEAGLRQKALCGLAEIVELPFQNNVLVGRQRNYPKYALPH